MLSPTIFFSSQLSLAFLFIARRTSTVSSLVVVKAWVLLDPVVAWCCNEQVLR